MILMGSAALGLIIFTAVILRRIRHDVRQLRHELLATRQQLDIQRMIIEDGDDGPPKQRRHLRALVLLVPLLTLFGWIRGHLALSTAAVGTVAAVVILAQTASPSDPGRTPNAAPSEPLTPPPSRTVTPGTVTSGTTTTNTAPSTPGTTAPESTADQTPGKEVGNGPMTSLTSTSEPSVPIATTTTSTGTTSQPPAGGPDRPAGGGLCVGANLRPVLDVALCLGVRTPSAMGTG